MKFTLIILFLLVSLLGFSQQLIELCEGESKTVTYFTTSTGDGSNIWTVNGVNFNTEDLTYTFFNEGVYNIVVKRENGPCYVEESIEVIVSECPGVIYWVPNCFTPDGNEYNQLFGPIMTEGYDINGFEFTIFNRWGNVVWVSNDPNGLWDGTFDGKRCSDGVYIWKLTFNILGNDSKIVDHGHLTLIK